MDTTNFALAEKFVDHAYISQGVQSRNSRHQLVRSLLANSCLPEEGWDETTIQLFLHELASMDSNNFPGNVGVGEREGRVYSSIVRARNFSLHHGIGRSGDIGATQPKAAGSSLLSQLVSKLALDAIRQAGFKSAKHAAVVPVATGMALTLTMCALRETRPPEAKKVLFPRIDQKSCVKSALSAGFDLIVVENTVEQDKVHTDSDAVGALLKDIPADEILCVLTTTSCFAPRLPDRVVYVAKECKRLGIPHIINNAYGVQSSRCMGLIDAACREGRVDVVVQSTDKNFLVPVGGAVLAATDPLLIDAVYKVYPGRASVSPLLDLFITLLHLGRRGWSELLAARKQNLAYLRSHLEEVASKFGERLLDTAENDISVGMTLSATEKAGVDPTFLGSMLFTRLVSGARVVPRCNPKVKVCGKTFKGGFGAHADNYHCSYMTMACALGVSRAEIDTACLRLEACLHEVLRRASSKASQ